MLRLPMREGEEKNIYGKKFIGRGEFKGGLFAQIRMGLVNIFAHFFARSHLNYFNFWMGNEQTQELPTRVARATNNGYFNHNYSFGRSNDFSRSR